MTGLISSGLSVHEGMALGTPHAVMPLVDWADRYRLGFNSLSSCHRSVETTVVLFIVLRGKWLKTGSRECPTCTRTKHGQKIEAIELRSPQSCLAYTKDQTLLPSYPMMQQLKCPYCSTNQC